MFLGHFVSSSVKSKIVISRSSFDRIGQECLIQTLRAVFWIRFCAYFGAYFQCLFWSVINRNRLEIGLFRQRYRKTILFNKSTPLAIRRYITYELSNYRYPYLLLHTIHSSSSYIRQHNLHCKWMIRFINVCLQNIKTV